MSIASAAQPLFSGGPLSRKDDQFRCRILDG